MEDNEQLEYMNNNSTKIFIGKKIEGKIISINNEGIYIALPGYKSDGFIPKNEIYSENQKDYRDAYNINDSIEAKVLNINNSEGYVLLSNIETIKEKAINELKQIFENSEVIDVIVTEAIKGGIIARYKEIPIFIPASHVDIYRVNDLEQYIGKTLQIRIIELREERHKTKIVGSRREVLQEMKDLKEKEALESLKEGDIVKGEVKNIVDYGAFVDINGIEGLIHVSEIGWGRNKIKNVLKTGDIITVKVIGIDTEKKKVSLSIKALSQNPWLNIEEKYPVGNITMGKVVRFTDFGAFVELEPGVDALLHISKISNQKINHPKEVLNIGEVIKATIIEIDSEKKRISLSTRDL
ncbi:S1 RNA-binding domain-containing protein [Clostridium polynesiense]|uniref:S1 RNA-binding domain-containing protein n=1 Tax=Clostridium polynesiense TaxID=1325933 RepID=UPI00058BF0E7